MKKKITIKNMNDFLNHKMYNWTRKIQSILKLKNCELLQIVKFFQIEKNVYSYTIEIYYMEKLGNNQKEI